MEFKLPVLHYFVRGADSERKVSCQNKQFSESAGQESN